MSGPPPQFKLAKRPPKSNNGGILPVPALATQKNTRNNDRNGAATSHRKGDSTSSQAPDVRLKLVVRRLAPGLTQIEFDTVLGDDWKPGAGRVDWMLYKPGKVSKDPAKPSKPARAYLHLTHPSHINPLRDIVRKSTFADAKNTTKDPALLGPPSLEFAPHQRVPASGKAKPRPDNKQGTIDQDNEFIAFLTELTVPVTKTKAENEGIAKEKPTTTPLIEHLREKKAAKEKGLTVKTSKHARQDSKESNDVLSDRSSPIKTRNDPIFSRDTKGAQHTKAEQSSRNIPQNLNKDAKPLTATATSDAGKQALPPQPAPASTRPAARREQGNMSGVARMLQRDLGLSPGSGRRGPRRDGNAEPNKPSPLKQEETATPGQAALGTASTPAVSGQSARNANPCSQRGGANTHAHLRANDKPILSQNTANSAEAQRRLTTGNPPLSSTSNVIERSAPVASPPMGPRGTSQPRGPYGRQPPKGPAGNELHRGPGVSRSPASSVSNPTIQPASPASSLTSPAANQTNPTQFTPANPQANLATPPATSSRFPKVLPTATQAFLKHANPSQGITEPLLEEAMRAFGSVTKVEIDQRKGFAYVDFAEPAALQKAVQAGNVKVAQGSVQVLERKDRKPAPPPAAFGSPGGPSMGPRGGMMGGGVGFRGGANFGPGFRGGRGGRGRGGGPGGGMGRGGGTAEAVPAAGATPAAALAASSKPAADSSKT